MSRERLGEIGPQSFAGRFALLLNRQKMLQLFSSTSSVQTNSVTLTTLLCSLYRVRKFIDCMVSKIKSKAIDKRGSFGPFLPEKKKCLRTKFERKIKTLTIVFRKETSKLEEGILFDHKVQYISCTVLI